MKERCSIEWRYKLQIFYYGETEKIDEKNFNNPIEIEEFLNKYEGFDCIVFDLKDSISIFEGSFDDSCLDDSHYKA